jgi:hypothetical protein
MTRKNGDRETLDLKLAKDLLETQWQAVVAEASAKPAIEDVTQLLIACVWRRRREIQPT